MTFFKKSLIKLKLCDTFECKLSDLIEYILDNKWNLYSYRHHHYNQEIDHIGGGTIENNPKDV